MIVLIIFLFCLFIVMAVGVLAARSDLRSLTIPNMYSVYVMAAFIVAYGAVFLSGNEDVFGGIGAHLISAGGTFIVTFILFALKIIGAGDSKFGTACALWVSGRYLPIFLFFMTLAGALLAIAALVLKRAKPIEKPLAGGWVDQVQGGADKVPYGVAIVFGMLVAFMYAGYFSPDVLASFVSVSVEEAGS